MEINYINDICYSYAVIKCDEKLETSYKIKMIVSNQIKKMLKTSTRIIDNEIFLYYNISSRQTLEEKYDESKLNLNELRQILVELYACINELKKHLLDVNDIILDPKFIYYDWVNNNYEFCYYPDMEKDFKSELNRFLQYILTKINHSDKEAVLLAYNLQDMCLQDNYIIDDILYKLTEDFSSDIKFEIQEEQAYYNLSVNNMNDKAVQIDKEADSPISKLVILIKEKIKALIRKPESNTNLEKRINDDTIILDNLKMDIIGSNGHIFLEYMGEDKKDLIKISEFPFLIGRSEDQVNLVIDESTISRLHVRITMLESEYFIEDLNSTNGTFINNERINSYTRIRMQRGDKVEFARIPYRFI